MLARWFSSFERLTLATSSVFRDHEMANWKVYLITNQRNGKGYVGITSKTIQARYNKHIEDAYPGRRNPNGTLYALHAAIQKYGEEAFSMRVLEKELTLDDARKREVHYIKVLGTYGGGRGRRGYNQSEGGELPDERVYDAPADEGSKRDDVPKPRPKIEERSQPRTMTIMLILAFIILGFLTTLF